MPIEGTGEKSQRQHPWPRLGRGVQGMIHLLPQEGDSPFDEHGRMRDEEEIDWGDHDSVPGGTIRTGGGATVIDGANTNGANLQNHHH